MLVDVIATTTLTRPDLLRRTLASLLERTDHTQMRLTSVVDGPVPPGAEALSAELRASSDLCISSRRNAGLAPALNLALAAVAVQWQPADFVLLLQDDVLVLPNWLDKLTQAFLRHEVHDRVGLATGLACPELAAATLGHSLSVLDDGCTLMPYCRAAMMFGRRRTFFDVMPIPPVDGETGQPRGRPHDGLGSGVDWHILRQHLNCLRRKGLSCLVVPDVALHLGYRDSTWLGRDLEEMPEDRAAIEKEMGT